jgi:hypothetical protein
VGSVEETVDWILAYGNQSLLCARTARKLLTMLVTVPMRTGHSPDLADARLRQAIRGMGLKSMLPMDPVRCLSCDCTAPLYDWYVLGTMSVEGQREAIMQATRERSLPLFLYLLPCPRSTEIRQPTSAGVQHG